MTQSDFKRTVEAFFEKKNPKKMSTVPEIVGTYDKKRARLWDKLFATYKVRLFGACGNTNALGLALSCTLLLVMHCFPFCNFTEKLPRD